MLAIPEQVQGMSFTLSGKIIFSTSYGRKNNSKIYVYDDVLLTERVGTYKIEETEIDLLACSSDLLKETIELINRKFNESFGKKIVNLNVSSNKKACRFSPTGFKLLL